MNQGISADTTVGMLKRVDLANATNAQTVAVMAGINDLRLGEPAEQVFKRYRQLIEELDGAQPMHHRPVDIIHTRR